MAAGDRWEGWPLRRMLIALVVVLVLLAAGAGSALAAVELQRPAPPPIVLAAATLDDQSTGSAQPGGQARAASQSQQSSAQAAAICPCQSGKRLPAPPPVPIWGGSAPSPIGGVPSVGGSVILVSIRQQWLWAYRNGTLIFASPVTTGQPQLPTPVGFFSVQWRVANTTFYSPWPPSSPYYYPPEHVNYALYFANYGFFIHDAPWRHCFGPGTNVPHTCPDGTTDTGSHGCVNVPTSTGAWLYSNIPNGAAVIIRG